MSKKVAIIPGHGGFDSGSVNPRNGARECDGTLGIALKLGELLIYNGIEPIYSRTIDIACGGAKTSTQDVSNQIAFVNNSGADIAMAIHFNGSPNASAHGVEVLYCDLMYPNPYEAKLANLLLNELIKTTGLTNRGLKTPDNISIVKKSKIPCVLSECAFVTNDQESIWCSSSDYQQKLAIAHTKAICAYFGITYKENSTDNITYFEALNTLVYDKVITTLDYWKNAAINNTDIRGDYMAKVIKNMTNINDLKSAINHLVDVGVLSSPDYWFVNCAEGKLCKIDYVKKLIVNGVSKLGL